MGARLSSRADCRPPRGASPLSRLATVELQLIMKASSARDIIRFARCAKHMRQAAQDRFVWGDCTLTITKLLQLYPESFGPFAAHLVVDVCPVLPPTPHGWLSSAASDGLMRLVSAVSVRRLDWSYMSQQQLILEDWLRLLRCESMRSLCAVCLPRYYDVAHCYDLKPSLLDALRSLPSLDTLRLGVVQVPHHDRDAIELPPALTALEFRQSIAIHVDQPPIPLSCVSRCTKLRTLELGVPIAEPLEFGQMWQSFASVGLERLHIDELQWSSTWMADEFAWAMQRLPCLDEIHLSRCVRPQKLIAAAFKAPALRRIILEAELSHLDPFANVSAVTCLLKCLRSHLPSYPLVFAELRMPRLSKKPSREEREYAEDARAQIAGSRELQALGARFKLSETLVRHAIR